ncbi:hypothetical protein OE88DRAFT_1657125 [Heliocybe sulcata]|uniref:Uncharacterized protein n=1 Tax=Heliocybe sulcata TaxID=5364 RepID=A0A5C3N8Q3_9AGAM|nr:hypothetical protein OE88DRAFT_1657125 [Heliocybe sulcata]
MCNPMVVRWNQVQQVEKMMQGKIVIEMRKTYGHAHGILSLNIYPPSSFVQVSSLGLKVCYARDEVC